MKLRKILVNNIGLKLLALALAFFTWLYVGEVTKLQSGKTVLQKLLTPTNYVSKKLYVRPIFVGVPPKGYSLLKDKVKMDPEFVLVVGPSNILSKQKFIYTKPIDLSEYTKSKTVNVEARSISRSIKFQKTEIQVFLPIEKSEE